MSDLLELTAGDSRAVFDPAGGARLTELVLGGRSLVVTSPPPDRAGDELYFGAFVMAPWTSTLRGGRFSFDGRSVQLPVEQPYDVEHGVVRRSGWQVEDGSLRAPIDWPYGGHAGLTPTLTDGRLDLRFSVTAGEVTMPAAIGWHPWFVRRLDGAEVELTLPPGLLVQHRDPSGVPTGRWARTGTGPWNDCLRSGGPAVLDWPGAGRLTISWSSDYVTVYSTNPHGICVEPVTSPAETMDRVLAPGETLTLDVGMAFIGRK